MVHKQEDKITVSSLQNNGYVIKLRPDEDVLDHLPHEKDQTKTDVYIQHEHIPDQVPDKFSGNYPSSSTVDSEESTQLKRTFVGNMACTDEPTPVVDYEESMTTEALSESDIEIFQEIFASKSDANEPPTKKPKHEHIPDQVPDKFSGNHPSSSTADLEESTQVKGTFVRSMACTDDPTHVVDYEERMTSEALSESNIEIIQEIFASKSDTNEPSTKKSKHDSVPENSVVIDLTNSTRVLENKASKDVPKMNNLQFLGNSIASKEKEETGASVKYVVNITGKRVSVKCSVCCKTLDGSLPAQKLQSLLKHVRSSEHLMNVGNQNQAFLENLDKDKISLLEEQNYMKFFEKSNPGEITCKHAIQSVLF